MMNNNYGTAMFDGKVYKLLQKPYCVNAGTEKAIQYCAEAEDEQGNSYIVVWDAVDDLENTLEVEAMDIQSEQEEYAQYLASDENPFGNVYDDSYIYNSAAPIDVIAK